MQALENTARLSWVKTYPVWPNVRKDERNRRIQVLNVGLDLYMLFKRSNFTFAGVG
jgi:hypothetical protein